MQSEVVCRLSYGEGSTSGLTTTMATVLRSDMVFCSFETPAWLGFRNAANLHLSLNGGYDFSIAYWGSLHVLEPPLILSSTLELATGSADHDILYVELSTDMRSLSADYLGCTVSV